MRLTLDTNILVYAADRDAGVRHQIALNLVRQARGRDCVITLQALAELFNALVRKNKVPIARATAIVTAWREAVPCVAADDACLIDAMAAVADHGLSFWDAMIWATAKRSGCRLLISEDGQDGRTLGGVTIVNPFASTPSPLIAAALQSPRPSRWAVLDPEDERLAQVARLTEFLTTDWGNRDGISAAVASIRSEYAETIAFYTGSTVASVLAVLKASSFRALLDALSIPITIVEADWDGWDDLKKSHEGQNFTESWFTILRGHDSGRTFFANQPAGGWINAEAFQLLDQTHSAARAYALGSPVPGDDEAKSS
jgi:predicted nucleic acid-binding protein